MSTFYHYLNKDFSTVARAAVRIHLPRYVGSSSSHDGNISRFSNPERVLHFRSLMVIAELLLGCFLQKIRNLVPRPCQTTRSLASSPPTHLISELA